MKSYDLLLVLRAVATKQFFMTANNAYDVIVLISLYIGLIQNIFPDFILSTSYVLQFLHTILIQKRPGQNFKKFYQKWRIIKKH